MKFDFKTKEQQNVWQILNKINIAWSEGDPKEISSYFHDDMVISTSDFQVMGKSKEICVQSYVDFTTHAKINNFEITDITIEVFGNTATAQYSFELSYEINNEKKQDSGQEAFVFSKDNNENWLAVWRIIKT